MSRRRKALLLLLYIVFLMLVIFISIWYAMDLMLFDSYALVLGSSSALFQVIFALHLYWRQALSEDELNAIVIIFDNLCRRTIVKKIHDSAPIWKSELMRKTGYSFTMISANLTELENSHIIIGKPELLPGSERAVKMYTVSPEYGRIAAKIRERL